VSTIFSKILNKEIPCYKVYEDEKFLVFLDVFPLVKGHCLVIPKQEVDYIFDIEDELLGEMIIFSKKIAKAIQLAIPCKKIGVSVIGLEVAHAHIHLIPMNEVSDMNFSAAKKSFEAEEMQNIATAIASYL
jgi:histidine triad (HIT) family protein